MANIKISIYLILFIVFTLLAYCVVYESNIDPTPQIERVEKLTPNMRQSEKQSHLAVVNESLTPLPSEEIKNDYINDLSYALSIENNPRRVSIVKSILNEWFNVNNAKVINWLLNQEKTTEMGEYLQYILQKSMLNNLIEAGEIIVDLPNFDAKQSIINDYLTQLTPLNPDLALSWSFKLGSEYINNAQSALFEIWAANDPETVLDYLLIYNEIDETVKQNVLIATANQFASQDPIQFSAMFWQYPEKYHPQFVYSIIANWPKNKLTQAKHWIDSIDDGQLKNQAIKSYIDYVGGGYNPEETMALAQEIAELEMRYLSTRQVYYEWSQTAPSDAMQAIAKTNLPSTMQQQLLHSYPQNNLKFR